MFDVNSLDRLNFGDLGRALERVLEQKNQLAEERSEDEDDPRSDVLLVIANQIILRMDSIIREHGLNSPELLDRWNRQTKELQEEFDKYARTYLKEGVPLVLVEPERSDEIVLDEKLLEGMNARDLFEVNRFITDEVGRLDEELPEDVSEPIIEKLLKFGQIVFKRLDPLVRETYRDKPERLAEWVAIVDDYKDLDDEGGGHAQAGIESTEVS
ncbi:MAG: hypothetical protein ACJ754_16285 [Pyrinomonadaceae bacterium]